MKRFLMILAILLSLIGCKKNDNQNTKDMNTNETFKEVAGRTNFGQVSGNDVPDKVSKVGFTVTPSPNVDAPIINEYPLTLECKVVSWGDGVLVDEAGVILDFIRRLLAAVFSFGRNPARRKTKAAEDCSRRLFCLV